MSAKNLWKNYYDPLLIVLKVDFHCYGLEISQIAYATAKLHFEFVHISQCKYIISEKPIKHGVFESGQGTTYMTCLSER